MLSATKKTDRDPAEAQGATYSGRLPLGLQSAMACQQLRKEGFEDVHNLRGGVLVWQGANLPLSKKKH